jgi:hypothetical protein
MSPKLRMGLMLAGLVVAGWLAIFGDKTPVDGPVAARAPERAVGHAPRSPADDPVAVDSEQEAGPVRRILSRSGWFVQASTGTDIFATPAANTPAQAQEAPPSPPPESPFRLIGRLEEAGRWSYFLERDDLVNVMHLGSESAGFRLDSATDHELKLTRLSDRAGFVIAIDSDKH